MKDLHKELWGLAEEWASLPVTPTAAKELAAILTRHNIPRPRVCGECGWWDECQKSALLGVGLCKAPCPISSQGRNLMDGNRDATTCDCFKPRNEEE